MKHVTITELREKLSHYLARIRTGERLRVTCSGRVIAEIAPPLTTADEVKAARSRLRGSVRCYEGPLDPAIDASEWKAYR